ncbi:cysteine desulfurase IscS [Rubrobacter xylanophilus]|uniref:Cysteine desulfurase IscS n=1 Tax=Rubrobacter xylanophilus TaxID=49319 RepID=A0A510HFS6_9ACTN|nr:cysteine desulfurase family protein [Rubrobacter xylanophilus]BBL78812.1 cysteine desulfurase IscS [Rubrobacter xylanophilus]
MTAEKSAVYLDNAATTPLDERVLGAMLEGLRGLRGNPSALHAPGADAREAIEEAREGVAALIGASPEEVVFTSGGTEADNLALFGLARSAPSHKRHAVISRVEHPAVREAGRRLEAEGFEVTWLGVDGYGLVDPGAFEAALREDTAFAAVIWASDEVGSVQPVGELAAACAERGVRFHADAVQAAGRLPVDVGEVPVSTLALSAHKLYGPQGVGALYVREGAELSPLVLGAGQERGLRSGTENVAAIAGFGVAARLAAGELEERARHERALRDRILAGVREMEGIRVNGHPRERLPNNVHLTVEGVEAEGLVLFLDALGYAVGSGASCSSGGHKASPVLLAMGLGEREAFSSIRVSVGKDNTPEEIDGFLAAFRQAVGRLRELSPLQAG